MQICFRCDDSINALLEKRAHAYGISKSQLMNSIVQEYPGQNPSHSKASCTAKAGKEIPAELRRINEILTRFPVETNDLYFSSRCKHTHREFNESFRFFRTELIEHPADISDRLDRIRKDMVP